MNYVNNMGHIMKQKQMTSIEHKRFKQKQTLVYNDQPDSCRGRNANLSKQLDNKIWADNQEIEEIKRTKKSQKKELPKNHFYWSTYETDIFYWSIKITIFFLLINKTNLK